MPSEVSRRDVKLVDAANVEVTVVSYSDGSDSVLSGVPVASTPFFTAALTAKQAVKTSKGILTYYHIENPNTADAWVQIFDTALAGVTVGTTTPKMALWVSGNGALDTALTSPAEFATAITIAATTTPTGSTAPSTGLVVTLLYQ